MKKRFLAIMCVAILALIPGMAMADSLTLTSNYGNVPQYGGSYVGPIGATLNGVPISGGIACTDEASISYFGSTIGVTVSTPADVRGTRFKSVQEYEEAAWLLGQIFTNPGQIGPIQLAEWGVFNSSFASTLNSDAKGWLSQAESINLSGYDFSLVRIYTPTFAYASNQEFISGDPPPVPVPPSVLLLGTGLLGLVGLRKFRKS